MWPSLLPTFRSFITCDRVPTACTPSTLLTCHTKRSMVCIMPKVVQPSRGISAMTVNSSIPMLKLLMMDLMSWL